MGCDIHLYTERKVNGVWQSADVWTKDEYYENDNVLIVKDPIYYGRNYDLFAILADVRNGYGVAGISTGQGFKPISKRKGFPADCDNLIRECRDDWGCDGHSDSYLTLKELLDYDWDQKTVEYVTVSEKEYIEWKDSKETLPVSWCAHITGPNVKILSEKDYIFGIENDKLDDDSMYYISCEVNVTYRECVGDFIDTVIPVLKTLDDDPENVRIVFWFDN